jgi:vacuolar-type H+-ATPase subunit I/STV1
LANAAIRTRIAAIRGGRVSSKLSVAEVLGSLEARAAFHREREAFHAAQEEQHRQERARHAAELETVLHNLEAFRTVSASAVELVRQATPPAVNSPPNFPPFYVKNPPLAG